MVLTRGVCIAVLNSVINALCDPLRKYLTKFMSPFALVAARGMIQAPLFCLWAAWECGGELPRVNRLFVMSACISGLINIATSYLYNRSIQISSLSATVPYLSLTPAFLIVVAFLALGEVPTWYGVIGVSIAVAGGFALQKSRDRFAEKDLTDSHAQVAKGTMYMVLVAFLWSISNAFDKIGVQNSSPLVYGATIQVIVAVGSLVLHKLRLDHQESLLPSGVKMHIPWRMVALAGVTSVISYYINLVATQNLEVSYVIAIKRSGCIWSVLLGKVFFNERHLRQKLPSICLMVIGVCCIILGKTT